MSSKQLCGKCRSMLSAQLIHFSADELSGGREPQHTHLWLFEKKQDSDTEAEQVLRPHIEAIQLARRFLRHLDSSFIRTGSRDYFRGIPRDLHLDRNVLLHHSWPMLGKSADNTCYLCLRLHEIAMQKVSAEVRGSMQYDLASLYSSPGVPILVIDGLRSPDSLLSSKSHWLPYPYQNSKWRQTVRLYIVWFLKSTGVFEIALDLRPYAYGWDDHMKIARPSDDAMAHPQPTYLNEEMQLRDANPSQTRRSLNTHLAQPLDQARGHVLSALTRSRLLQWIAACDKHASCHQGYVPFWDNALPRRLVEIRSVDAELAIRIIEAERLSKGSSQIKYATLSHCWGPQGPPIRLLQSNATEFSKNIPFESLPRTFQEAIDVARVLNIDYLWVDALCIVQDLESDWQTEAPRMMAIYSGGVVNIAATNAEDDSAGLLTQDFSGSAGMIKTSWEGSWLPPTEFSIEAFFTEIWNRVDESPLNRRAWVFQERLLSPRVIHFCADQIRWECRETNDQERLPLSVSLMSTMSPYRILTAGSWARVVEMYSRTSLTFATDRLVAFAGVAQVFSASHGPRAKDYVAGLWAESIKSHLLWRAAEDDGSVQVSTEYIAPSWSWASNDGPVAFWTDPLPFHMPKTTVWRVGFEVLDTSISLKTASEFGQVNGGYLLVKAGLQRVRLSVIERSQSEEGLQDRIGEGHSEASLTVAVSGADEPTYGSPQIETGARFTPDSRQWLQALKETKASHSTATAVQGVEVEPAAISQGLGERSQTYLMPMAKNKIGKTLLDDSTSIRGLVLERLDGRGLYKRIGYLRYTYRGSASPSWWENGDDLERTEYLERFSHRMYKIKIV